MVILTPKKRITEIAIAWGPLKTIISYHKVIHYFFVIFYNLKIKNLLNLKKIKISDF